MALVPVLRMRILPVKPDPQLLLTTYSHLPPAGVGAALDAALLGGGVAELATELLERDDEAIGALLTLLLTTGVPWGVALKVLELPLPAALLYLIQK